MEKNQLYVEQSLGTDEEIVYVAKFHWFYTLNAVSGIVWGIIGCIAVIVLAIKFGPMIGISEGVANQSWLAAVRALHPGLKLLAFLVFVFGLLRFAQMMVIKITTEIVITTSRLIYKRGLVARYVGEMSIDRIEGVNVLQGIMGRIFNYGRVRVRGMGVGELVLPVIDEPIAFRKAIESARNS